MTTHTTRSTTSTSQINGLRILTTLAVIGLLAPAVAFGSPPAQAVSHGAVNAKHLGKLNAGKRLWRVNNGREPWSSYDSDDISIEDGAVSSLAHLFIGGFNSRTGSADGMHYLAGPAADPDDVRSEVTILSPADGPPGPDTGGRVAVRPLASGAALPGRRTYLGPDDSGVYATDVWARDGMSWTKKAAPSTTFPASWTVEDVLGAVDLALGSATKDSGDLWAATVPDPTRPPGSNFTVDIEMVRSSRAPNEVITAYPRYRTPQRFTDPSTAAAVDDWMRPSGSPSATDIDFRDRNVASSSLARVFVGGVAEYAPGSRVAVAPSWLPSAAADRDRRVGILADGAGPPRIADTSLRGKEVVFQRIPGRGPDPRGVGSWRAWARSGLDPTWTDAGEVATFPGKWSPSRVVAAINEAKRNSTQRWPVGDGTEIWSWRAPDGVQVNVVVDPSTGQVLNGFPSWEGARR